MLAREVQLQVCQLSKGKEFDDPALEIRSVSQPKRVLELTFSKYLLNTTSKTTFYFVSFDKQSEQKYPLWKVNRFFKSLRFRSWIVGSSTV